MVHNPSDDEIILESDDLCQAFLDEIGDDLLFIEQVIIEISDGKSTPDDVAEAMRRMHSQKGSAGALNYTVIMKAIHQMEETVIHWQKTKGAIELDSLLDKIDIIRSTITLSTNASLSRKEYIQEYEKLRESLRKVRSSDSYRVLIIDAVHASSMMIKNHLEAEGLETVVCTDGYTALGRILHDQIDAVVCGGMTMVLDGPALIAAVKLNHKTADLLTLLLTSKSKPKFPVMPDKLVGRSEGAIKEAAKWLAQQSTEKAKSKAS